MKRLSETAGYIVAKLQEGYGLQYFCRPYAAYLTVPEGGHFRAVPHAVVKQLHDRGLIQKVDGTMSSAKGARFILTTEGYDQ